MRLFGGRRKEAPRRAGGLAADARAMRATLAELHAEQQLVHGTRAPVQLKAIVRDLLEGEIAAPTADVTQLVRGDPDPDDFYAREIEPAWDGLGEGARASRVEGFVDLAQMLDKSGEVPGLDPAVIHTKTLILAWAFDETYGYLTQLARGESR